MLRLRAMSIEKQRLIRLIASQEAARAGGAHAEYTSEGRSRRRQADTRGSIISGCSTSLPVRAVAFALLLQRDVIQ